ncbi:FkbM family methyltransferase [Candidatus Parcubacteria bacterium]|nr:FkbM family methyltransferase [Candidatus Parcubacteria bacterium]
MNFLDSKKKLIGIILFLSVVGSVAFFDKTLAIGIILLVFLSSITFLILSKIGMESKRIFLLFLIALLIHFGVVLFIHYAHFQPFSGGQGDYVRYHQEAQEVAQRILQGNFSLQGLSMGHYYPVIIGCIYALTLPEMLIGQLFGVWLAALSVILVYLIVLEIGGSKNWAFLIGLIASIYPSYLFFGSLLLKDVLVVPLALAGLLFCLRLIKNFSWKNFLVFYIILAGLIHFRFYIGYVLLFTFIFCWLILAKLDFKKKFIYAIIIILLLGFLPQISGYGYYGISTMRHYISIKTITFYREVAYAPPSLRLHSAQISDNNPIAEQPLSAQGPAIGEGSSIVVETGFDNPLTFARNYFESFTYVLLGPLPWQIKHQRQLFALLETIPWYFLLFFIIKGILISFKKYRIAIPLVIFSFGVLAVLTLFLSNFGIVTRIRMPAFLALLPFIALHFQAEQGIKWKATRRSLVSKYEDVIQQFFAGIGLYFLVLYLRIKFRVWVFVFQNRNRGKRWFKKRVNESIMILDSADKGISWELLYVGIRENRSTEFLRAFLNPGDMCVDIGANIGYYALLEARLVGKNGKIFAIEPSYDNIKLLNKNIALNQYDNIVSYRGAVGSKNCLGNIKLSRGSNRHSFVNANLDFSGKTEQVKIMALDTFLQDKPYPQFVRMDVEGYEEEVIKGMRHILAQKKPLKMFIEFHCPLLENGGYELLHTLRDADFTIKAVFKERLSLLTREDDLIISLYDFLFRKRFYLLNNSLVNYDIPIDAFLQHLPKFKDNVFELFLERT